MPKHELKTKGQSFWEIVTSPQARKFQIAVVSVILAFITAGLIPPEVAIWIQVTIAGLASAGVYLVPNEKPGNVIQIPYNPKK